MWYNKEIKVVFHYFRSKEYFYCIIIHAVTNPSKFVICIH